MTDKSISSVPLVEVIDALREDLKTAQEKKDPKYPLIIEEIEVELQAVITKGVDGKGKVKVEVFGVGGEMNLDGAWSKALTQKIKLKLSAGVKDQATGKITRAKVNDEADFE